MRIIAGLYKGRRLTSPRNDKRIRPTSDRIRESVFSILGDLSNTVIVDGFAGTGALGCEALSRGARFCYFFDQSYESIKLVKENIRRIDAEQNSAMTCKKFNMAIKALNLVPNYIFLDPPYHTTLAKQAFDAIETKYLALETPLPQHDHPDIITIILEQDIDDPVPDTTHITLEDERCYGRTRITFWQLIYRSSDEP